MPTRSSSGATAMTTPPMTAQRSSPVASSKAFPTPKTWSPPSPARPEPGGARSSGPARARALAVGPPPFGRPRYRSADRLQVPVGTPLLLVVRELQIETGRTVDLGYSYLRDNRYTVRLSRLSL